MRRERGQATIESVALALLVALALAAALAAAAPHVDGRAFGGLLAHRLVCAVRGGCDDGDAELARAYGERDARLVRAFAPGLVYEPGERQLPVDWRRCRAVRCASAPDDRELDAHRSETGASATAFTRVVRRHGRLYLQYWLYYPDSNTTFASSDRLWHGLRRAARTLGGYPGFHRDDWEGYQVRIDRRGRVAVRATSHGHYQWCKWRSCRNVWGPGTGWTRVSRGSHAGHVPLGRAVALRGRGGGRRPRIRSRYRALLPGRDLRERTTTADGLRLVPLESVARRGYRPLDRAVTPPWRKRVYRRPADAGS